MATATPAPAPAQNTELQQNNPIQRKLNKILESRIENEKVNLSVSYSDLLSCFLNPRQFLKGLG